MKLLKGLESTLDFTILKESIRRQNVTFLKVFNLLKYALKTNPNKTYP
jgi:hypothetical protein